MVSLTLVGGVFDYLSTEYGIGIAGAACFSSYPRIIFLFHCKERRAAIGHECKCIDGWGLLNNKNRTKAMFLGGTFQEKSGHRCRVKHRQLVMQSPLIRESFLLPAGDVENKVEQLPAHFFNGFFAGSDSARVNIH